MLEQFEIWLNQEKSKIESIGYVIDVKKVLSVDNEGIRVDLDSDNLIARMTVEKDEMCVLEIINVESEETIFYNKIIIEKSSSNYDFNSLFYDFIDKLDYSKT